MSFILTDPTGKIDNTAIPAGANITHDKIVHRNHPGYGQASGADAVAATQVIFQAFKSCTVLAGYVTPDAVPAGGTKTMTVDVKTSTGGGAWSTILSATTTLTTSSVARTPVALSLSGTPSISANDLLQVVVTVGGSGGTGVQGFRVELVLSEQGT